MLMFSYGISRSIRGSSIAQGGLARTEMVLVLTNDGIGHRLRSLILGELASSQV